MTDLRRYDDDEVRSILERATRVEAREVSAVLRESTSSGGLSLSELQAVGVEAGIDPGRIAEAAAALARFGGEVPAGRRFGVDLAAAHTVELPRILTDLEWDHFVVRLRDAFGAPGQVLVEGSLRTWTHTHVQVLLEPTPGGARLRMSWNDWGSRQWVESGVVAGASGVLGLGLFGGLTLFATAVPAALAALAAPATAIGGASWGIGRWMAARRTPTRRAKLEALGDSVLAEMAETDRRVPPTTS